MKVRTYIMNIESEKEVKAFVAMFIEEIDRIETFFVTKLAQLKEEFKQLKS